MISVEAYVDTAIKLHTGAGSEIRNNSFFLSLIIPIFRKSDKSKFSWLALLCKYFLSYNSAQY